MSETTTRAPVGLPVITALMLVIGFTYSDDIIEFALDIAGRRFAGAGPYLVFVLDLFLALATAALKWRMSRDTDLRAFLRRLVTGKWGWGVAVLIVTHLVLIATAAPRERFDTATTVTISLLATLAFLVVMTLFLITALGDNDDHSTLSWAAPIVLGAVAAQLASALWYPIIDVKSGCAGEVASWYFSDMGHITPVILLTLGLELNYLRRNSRMLNAGQRVAPLLTVLMLGISEMLAFSMIVKADMPKCGFAAVWHEYISFVFTAQSLTTGLTTLLWLLLSDEQGRRSVGGGNSL